MLKRRLSLTIALVLLATAARLFGIQTQSIWFDEGWSAYAAAQPTLIGAWQADPTNPPLYYLLLNVAARGFGTTEFGLRVFSLLIGLLTIPLIYQLARRVAMRRPSDAYRADAERAGGYAALLAAVSAPLWWASQEARMYTLLAVLILIAALAWHSLMTKPTRAAWVALWLSELALLYTHNTVPVAALWLNGVTLLFWVAHRRLRRRRNSVSFWRVWIAGQIGVGLLWLPYFVSRFLLLPSANSAITSAPQIGLALLAQVWSGLWIAPWALAIAGLPIFTILLALLLIVLLIAAPALLLRAFWLIVHVVILTVGLIAGLIMLGNDLHGRYLVMIVGIVLASISVGLASLRDRRVRFAVLLPFLLLSVIDVIAAQNPAYQHDDARSMVQYYADHLNANDSVIAWSYADRYDLAYYWDRLGVKAKRITLPEGADLDVVLPLLPPANGDVALNVWYTQRADYRGMMGCVLGSGTINEPDSFTTSGMTTLLYHQPSLRLPPLLPVNLTFSDSGANPVAQINGIGQAQATTAERALCLPIQIRLLRTVDVDLKAALIVENDLGWTVASADAIFASADERTSSALAAGDLLTAYPLLRLPYGAPAGDYRVFLRLYDETVTLSGYNPPQTGQTVAGRDLLLTTWTALPGGDWSLVTRTTDLPNLIHVPVSADLTLLADNLPSDRTLTNGDEIRAALLWNGTGALPDLELADDGGSWRVDVPTRLSDHGAITLDWRSIRVPADAPSGSATLRRVGGIVLAHYQIEALPLLSQAPPFDHAVGADFPGVGELVGYTLSGAPISRDNPPQVTLIWRAGDETPATSYTVTAQLIDAAGQVIAQSDAIPGSRPTTGWRAGEYIVDARTLSFNENAAPGVMELIVALYDAQNGVRLRLANRADAVTLATEIEVR